MSDITTTLSSPTVFLADGKGTLALSVTNASAAAQRVVLGAYPVAPATGVTYATIDRALRTIAAGGTEQYVVTFDTTGAPAGAHQTRFIAYSADGAPEDYADQAKIVTLEVPAESQPAKKEKKRMPWLIIAIGAAVLVAVAVAVFFVTRPPAEKQLAWVPTGPVYAQDPAPDNWYALLEAKDCAGLAALPEAQAEPVWAGATAVCAATIEETATAWEEASVALNKTDVGDDTDCITRAAYDLLNTYVTFHRNQPDTTVEVVPAPEGDTACKPVFTGLTLRDVYVPTTQPWIGTDTTVPMRVLGRFNEPVEVLIEGAPVPTTKENENFYVFTAPPKSVEDSVSITVRSAGELLGGGFTFDYVKPADPNDCPVYRGPWCLDLEIKQKLIDPLVLVRP